MMQTPENDLVQATTLVLSEHFKNKTYTPEEVVNVLKEDKDLRTFYQDASSQEMTDVLMYSGIHESMGSLDEIAKVLVKEFIDNS